jgi:hypothetical protein
LKSLANPAVKKGKAGFIKGNLQVSGVEWSSSEGKHEGEKLGINLYWGDAQIYSSGYYQTSNDRALCVRSRAE